MRLKAIELKPSGFTSGCTDALSHSGGPEFTSGCNGLLSRSGGSRFTPDSDDTSFSSGWDLRWLHLCMIPGIDNMHTSPLGAQGIIQDLSHSPLCYHPHCQGIPLGMIVSSAWVSRDCQSGIPNTFQCWISDGSGMVQLGVSSEYT